MNQPSLTVHNRQGYESSSIVFTLFYQHLIIKSSVTTVQVPTFDKLRFRQNIFVKKSCLFNVTEAIHA
jgi:hypothetical protein